MMTIKEINEEFDKEFYAYSKKNKRLKYPLWMLQRDKHIKNFIAKVFQKEKEDDDTEYLVIGSDNFWYESGAKELKEAIAEVKDIKKGNNIKSYADPETGFTRDVLPETFYIYKATLVKEI